MAWRVLERLSIPVVAAVWRMSETAAVLDSRAAEVDSEMVKVSMPQAEFSGETSPEARALRRVFRAAGLRSFSAATSADSFVDGLFTGFF